MNVAFTEVTTELFDDLLAALNEIPDVEQREQLVIDVEEMKSTQVAPGVLSRYRAFMQDAANHMTVAFSHGCEGSPTTEIAISVPEEITNIAPA